MLFFDRNVRKRVVNDIQFDAVDSVVVSPLQGSYFNSMLGVAKVGKTWFCATTTKREIWLLSCIKVNYLQVRGERPWSGQAGEQHQHRRE